MNVNTAQVTQAKLEALIEAAERVLADSDACYQEVSYGARPYDEVRPWMWLSLRQLAAAIAEARKPAALTAPEPEGDVVERAALIARDAYQRGMWQGAFKDTMTMDGWRAVAHALAAAGLLARPVDRERLAEKLYLVFDPVVMLAWEQLSQKYRDTWLYRADAILREIGGGR